MFVIAGFRTIHNVYDGLYCVCAQLVNGKKNLFNICY